MKKLVLGSNSPRRKEILKEFGFEFEVRISTKEEIIERDKTPSLIVQNLAKQKAENVVKNNDEVVLGFDTIVVLDNEILGKPKDKEEAFNMLKRLSNKTHFVHTGYAIILGEKMIVGEDVTSVEFNNLSEELINDYLSSNLWIGKAGSYGIQDGYPLVKEYKGSYYNVVGLPIEKVKNIIKDLINE